MKKVLIVFGTRPEAIKMCPVIRELQKHPEVKTIVCVSGQHKEMLDQVLKIFSIVPDYDLKIMQIGQSLFDITELVLNKFRKVLELEKPDLVLVHGDTSTTFAASLACYYMNVPVGHVEAGLRTYNSFSPYPEEFNRQAVGVIAKYHFAPTEMAKNNLLTEHKRNVFLTGNTSIDSLKFTVSKDYCHEYLKWKGNAKLILLTAHRRENLGSRMHHMFRAIRRVLIDTEDVKVLYPVHKNPVIREIAHQEFGGLGDKLLMVEPMDVVDFHNILARSYMVLTDSGGVQEEAPSLGIPVLVMRDTTERPEGVQAGVLRLVGTQEDSIYSASMDLLCNKAIYQAMAHASNPFGDGFAAKRITNIILKEIFAEK